MMHEVRNDARGPTRRARGDGHSRGWWRSRLRTNLFHFFNFETRFSSIFHFWDEILIVISVFQIFSQFDSSLSRCCHRVHCMAQIRRQHYQDQNTMAQVTIQIWMCLNIIVKRAQIVYRKFFYLMMIKKLHSVKMVPGRSGTSTVVLLGGPFKTRIRIK